MVDFSKEELNWLKLFFNGNIYPHSMLTKRCLYLNESKRVRVVGRRNHNYKQNCSLKSIMYRYHWRRRDFFGAKLRPLKGYHAPQQGVQGAAAPRMVTKFKILKRFKVLENESIFQEFQHFSSPKNQFFLIKISKNLTFNKNYF